VDWYPWGDEAFARARKEDKPVFLSIGYSSCHWCHVMERESFEDEGVAEALNDLFVSIKVDREERPDVDEIYMSATQLISGHGGWPNSLFLTHDRRPFFAGTYFPSDDRYGRPGFKSVLRQLASAWRSRRAEVERQAEQIALEMRTISSGGVGAGSGAPASAGVLSRGIVDETLEDLRRSFDPAHGGFGAAPKFPPHGALELILAADARRSDPSLIAMATRTLEAMIRGGIHDQIGGGFARYSTDDVWLAPHFEKMLYDNAQILSALPRLWERTRNPEYRRAAEGIVKWALEEMRGEEGGFYSALDADSEGEEGKCYLWSRAEIRAVLGPKDGDWFAGVFGVADRGNFVDPVEGTSPERNILHWTSSPEAVAKGEGVSLEALFEKVDACSTRLLSHRRKRPAPFRDDKILSAWNGLMIRGLSLAGRLLEKPDWIDAAARAAEFALTRMRVNGRLAASWRDGKISGQGFLDDYAFLADGLLELHAVTGDESWLSESATLVEVMLEHFEDRENGGFYLTADDHETLLFRPRDPFDKALPSGNGIAAKALLELGARTGDDRYRSAAERTFKAFAPLMSRAARAMQSLVAAQLDYLEPLGGVSSAAIEIIPPGGRTRGAAGGPTGRQATSQAREIAGETAASAERGPVRVTCLTSSRTLARGRSSVIEFVLEIADGWRINANQPLDERLTPTAVGLARNRSIFLSEVEYPAGVDQKGDNGKLGVYEGETILPASLYVPSDALPGPNTARFEITFQPCSDRECLAVETLPLDVEFQII
jgi:uncharacterized protein YyaL (SSP411 family)